MKYILKIVIGIFLLLFAEDIAGEDLVPNLKGGGIFLLLDVLVFDFFSFIYLNWKRFVLILHTKYLAIKGEYIRFSMSYQYIIKVNDKYLLVKNSNWDFYQSVGGKYKRNARSQQIIQNLEGKDDLKLETTGYKKDDFAVFIPAKNAIKFLDWFKLGQEREVSHWREFYEELIEGKANVLTKENFPYVDYDYLKTIRTPLRKSPNLKCWEILQYDILLLIPNEVQLSELEKLKEGDSDYFKWADNELIQNDGHNIHKRTQDYKIGEHTKWVVNQKWSKN